MQKIPTIFVRDETSHQITLEWHEDCLWVRDGEGQATQKIDGMNVKVENGTLLKRKKPAIGDYTNASYVPAFRSAKEDTYLFEAFDAIPTGISDGIYEAAGPKI